MSSTSIASRIVRIERASIVYLVLAYAVVSTLLAAQWVRAVAAMGAGLDAPVDDRVLESGGAP